MGANIGTTVTALIAAMSTEANVFEAALTIALAHVLFNLLGATILFPIKPLREIPVKLSRKGQKVLENQMNFYSELRDENSYLGGAKKYSFLYNNQSEKLLQITS